MSEGTELLAWLATVPPADRDRALDERWSLVTEPSPPPGEHMIGYHPSGVAPIVRMLLEVPVVREDVFVDLGAGLGKVTLLARLLTGATARGIELQPALVARARHLAARCGLDVEFEEGDARAADLDDGTVFFLYLPFTGPVLAAVLRRLELVAARRAIVVCGLGIDLGRHAPWLRERDGGSFWLSIYDSVVSGVAARPAHGPRSLGPNAERIAFERALD